MCDSGTGRTHEDNTGVPRTVHVGLRDGMETWESQGRPMWDCRTGETLGQSIPSHVDCGKGWTRTSHACRVGHMGVPRTFLPSHVGHMDTLRIMGHMGVPRTV